VTVYETLERPLVPVLVNMENEGMVVDRAVLQRLSSEFAATQGKIEQLTSMQLAGGPFNIGSPKQLGEILFGRMGLAGGRKTATGAWSTDSDALEDLAAQGVDLAKRVLDWRQLAKLRSTYTDALPNFINPRTHRVHTSYAMASTSTGRLASTDPNLQNIPVRTEEGRRIRTAFIAKLAHRSSAPTTRRSSCGCSPMCRHSAVEEGLRRGPRHPRHDGKRDVRRAGRRHGPCRAPPRQGHQLRHHLRHFGLRPANQLGISREEAGDYIRTYFKRFPGIKDYMEATKKCSPRQGLCGDHLRAAHAFPPHQVKNPSSAPSSSAPRSTRPSRARPPTSSAAP
jgi:DNA polymerase-1